MAEERDFFISYNQADQAWAEWITFQLELEGYTSLIQAWDFRPGHNFILEMNRATREAKRTIAVLSPDYLESNSEWTVAYKQGRLLPIRVRYFDDITELLGQIVFIDLANLVEVEARRRLLAGVRGERIKPSSVPFPGLSISDPPVFPGVSIERISKFSGFGSGTITHALGEKPDIILFDSVSRTKIWYISLTTTQVTVHTDSPGPFTGIAIKFSGL